MRYNERKAMTNRLIIIPLTQKRPSAMITLLYLSKYLFLPGDIPIQITFNFAQRPYGLRLPFDLSVWRYLQSEYVPRLEFFLYPISRYLVSSLPPVRL